MARVAKIRAVDRDGLAFDFVGPAGVVAIAIDDEREVGSHRIAQWLAVVERLQLGEFVLVLFDQVGELVHKAAALARIHLLPRALVERLARGFGGLVNVGLVTLGDVGDHLAGGRVEGLEGLAALGVKPLAVDEHLRLTDFDRELGLAVGSGFGSRSGGHGNLRACWSRNV